MTVQTAAGATLGVTSTAPASFDAYGYSQLTFTLIGELTDVGEFGRAYNLVKHNPLASRATVKRKGSFDDGSTTLMMGLDTKDAGQALLRAGVVSNNDFYFCLTLQNGDRVFFPAVVMSAKRVVGSVDKIVQRSATLELTSVAGVGIVELAAGVTPSPPASLIGTQVATRTYVPNSKSGFTSAQGGLVMTMQDAVAAGAWRINTSNWYAAEYGTTGAYTEQGTGGAITGTHAIEYPIGGTQYPITYQGSAALNVPDFSDQLSDGIGVAIPKGAQFRYVFNVAHPSGLPVTGNTPALTATAVGDSMTTNGGATNNSIGYQFGPSAVVAPTSVRSAGIFGNSIAHGEADTLDGSLAVGSIARQINTMPWGSITVRGDSAFTFKSSNGKRLGLARYFTDAIVEYGVNDLNLQGRTFAQAQADILSLATSLSATGLRVWATTVTPVSSSTDGYVTTGNQTTATTNAARSQLNDWFRTTPSPFAGYFDNADAVETSRNSGIWRIAAGVSPTYLVRPTDGIHPSPIGYAVLKQAAATRPNVIQGAWDPSTDAAVTFWINARDSGRRFADSGGTTISFGGQKVQTLIDRKGGAYFRQASATAPTTNYTSDNVLGFASASKQMLESTDAAAKALCQGTTPSVMVFTATRGTNTGSSTPFSWYNKATGVDFQWDYFDAAKNSVGSSRKTSAGQTYAGNGGAGGEVPQDTTERVFTRVYDGANVSWYINGSLVFTGPLGSASLTIDTMALGGLYAGSYQQNLNGIEDQIIGFAGKSARDASVIAAEKFAGAIAGIAL